MNWAVPQTLGFSLQMVTNQYLPYTAGELVDVVQS